MAVERLRTAVVTGAGSGVGQAVAWALAREGWKVALLGRRESALRETQERFEELRDCFMACPLDVGEGDAVEAAIGKVVTAWGGIEAVVNAAGMNIPQRKMDVLSLEDYYRVLQANLTGAFLVTRSALPSMRTRKSGTIVNINSEAGRLANPKAGTAYVISKFGLAGFTQALNVEEQVNGVRAITIFPGDINTPLLDKRPVPPRMEARAKMTQAEDIAACVLLAIQLPQRAVIEELLVRPLGG